MKTYLKSSLLSSLFVLLITAVSFGFSSPHEKIVSYEMNPVAVSYADQLPQPEGGYEALMNRVEYPELAISANLEGEVLAKVTVGDNGNVEDVKLLKTLGGGCDEAVVKAIKDTKFNYSPASEGTPLIRQISILFRFSKSNQ